MILRHGQVEAEDIFAFTVLDDWNLKAMANEDTLLQTQMFPRLPPRATFVADTNFVSATNVSQFARPKKHHGQQCVRNKEGAFSNKMESPA